MRLQHPLPAVKISQRTLVLMLRDAVNVAQRWEGNINPLFMNVGGPVSVAQWNSALDF